MLYTIIQISWLLLTVICLAAILKALRWALLKTEPKAGLRRKIILRVMLTMGIWLLIISGISFTDFIRDFDALPPRMFPLLLIPLLGLIWILRSPRTTKLLSVIPPQWLFYVQAFRIPVELMLWGQFALGLTPFQMTFEGYNFDIVAGITGPLVGWYIAHHQVKSLKVGILWNILSLGLLLNIVIIAILSFPSPFRQFMNEPANTLITYFPVIFLPLVLVPVAYFSHALSLKQLLVLQASRNQVVTTNKKMETP